MKSMNSIEYVVSLTDGLGIVELPLNGRSDKWWDMFWYSMGLKEANRLKAIG